MTNAFLIAGAAMVAAGLMPAVADAAPGATSAARRVIHQSTDASGTTTRVYYDGPADILLEIRNGRVTLQKHFTVGTSETTIQAGSDIIRLALSPSGVSVKTPKGALRMDGTEAVARRGRALLDQSPAFKQAVAMLSRVDVSRKTPVTPLLLTTKAFLQSLTGDLSGYIAMGAWSRQALPGSLFVKVRDTGPTECWNEYVKEAVAAFDELTDCLKNVQWWDMTGGSACTLIYDLRAIGAFSWWISCVSLDRKVTEAL